MKVDLDDKIEGLFMMIIFTSIWTTIGEILLKYSDYFIGGIAFGIIIIFLMYHYFKLKNANKILPKILKEKESKTNKGFLIIFGAEGLAIFIIQNILHNTNNDQFFISSLALIVGLHFFPLGKLFNRKFDYYIGIWTSLISILGIILISIHLFEHAIINPIVCFGCAISTSLYGIKMIKDSKSIIAAL